MDQKKVKKILPISVVAATTATIPMAATSCVSVESELENSTGNVIPDNGNQDNNIVKEVSLVDVINNIETKILDIAKDYKYGTHLTENSTVRYSLANEILTSINKIVFADNISNIFSDVSVKVLPFVKDGTTNKKVEITLSFNVDEIKLKNTNFISETFAFDQTTNTLKTIKPINTGVLVDTSSAPSEQVVLHIPSISIQTEKNDKFDKSFAKENFDIWLKQNESNVFDLLNSQSKNAFSNVNLNVEENSSYLDENVAYFYVEASPKDGYIWKDGSSKDKRYKVNIDTLYKKDAYTSAKNGQILKVENAVFDRNVVINDDTLLEWAKSNVDKILSDNGIFNKHASVVITSAKVGFSSTARAVRNGTIDLEIRLDDGYHWMHYDTTSSAHITIKIGSLVNRS